MAVAHRLCTVEIEDQVLVMEGDRIVEYFGAAPAGVAPVAGVGRAMEAAERAR
ncbi:hypothetical protein [Streptomyces sp. NPDC058644]|uniref:hypothetical protein n=1 Tax=unclassified Streptomyces TaxID=2593676 RepID=UPI00365608A4